LTSEPVALPPPHLVYVGHATVLIELDGLRLLTDPVLRRRIGHLRRRAPLDLHAVRDVDGVLVSHVHYDHLDRRSLALLDRDVPLVVPRGARRLFRRFNHVTELAVGEELGIGAVKIRATFAEHRAARFGLGAVPALGFLIAGSRTVYFAGDTDLFAGMSDISPALDLALLPVAGWGPRVGPGHLDPPRAVEALRRLQPRTAVPIHWGTFSIPGRPAATEAPEVFRQLAEEQVPGVDVRVLAPGSSTTF